VDLLDVLQEYCLAAFKRGVDLVVVSDAGSMLDVALPGFNGLGISTDQLAHYCKGQGCPQGRCLPILLDVGTHPERYEKGRYWGLQQAPLQGSLLRQAHLALKQAVSQVWPDARVIFDDCCHVLALTRYQKVAKVQMPSARLVCPFHHVSVLLIR